MTERKPLHIAIIPDGNRRWAKRRSLAPWKGHQRSADTFRDLITYCQDDVRVDTLTIWVFSTENWKRSPEEVEKLMSMFKKYLDEEEQQFHERNTRFVHSGRTDRLSDQLKGRIEEVQTSTADHDAFTLNVALDYGGKDEIVRAVRKMESTANIDEESLRAHLDHPELKDIDMVIRTSGERRTSNFFLWQTAYSEWYFTDVLFPDFTVDEMKKALDAYAERTRRFGG